MDAGKLAALEVTVGEIDSSSPAALAQQAEQQAQVTASEAGAKAWAQLPAMIGGLIGMLAPEVQDFYSEKACGEWGVAMQAVAEKRGWSTPDGVPEIALAASTLGMAVPTWLIVSAKLKAIKANQAPALGTGGAEAVVDTSNVPKVTRDEVEDGSAS